MHSLYNKITKDDVVIIKEWWINSGSICYKKVSIDNIRNKYQQYLCATDEFWISKNNSNYATLIVIDKIYKLKLFNINKRECKVG